MSSLPVQVYEGTPVGDFVKNHIHNDAVAEFLKGAKPRTRRALLDLFVWGWIPLILALSIFILFPSPWTFIISVLLAGSRMATLLTIAHDAQHGAFLPNKKWNDIVGAWLCAYPVGSIYGSSRAVHLAHHKLVGTPDDPDLVFYREDNKSTPGQFVFHFVHLVFGGQLWGSIILNGILRPLGKAPANVSNPLNVSRQGYPEILNLIPVQLTIWAVLWLVSGNWWLYFAIWVAPIFTLGTFFGFLRGFVDHARLATDKGGPADGRLVSILHPSLIERIYFCPLDFYYHAEHHLYGVVPHYYLPELHKILWENEAFRTQCIFRDSYLKFIGQYWQQICSSPAQGQTNV